MWTGVLVEMLKQMHAWLCCRSGPVGRIFVLDWEGCWTSQKPSSVVGSQRETTRRRQCSAD